MFEIIIILFAIISDRISKWLAVTYLLPVGSIPLIPGVFQLRYTQNTGAAFSILSDQTTALGIVSVIMSFVLTAYLVKERRKSSLNLSTIGLAMIIGGAIGNGIDRLWLHYVIDYFEVLFVRFAIFNVADSFVTIGVILVIFDILFLEKKRTALNSSRSGEVDLP